MARYKIEEYSAISHEWDEIIAFDNIVSAVKDYQYLVEEYPETAYRLIEIHEVGE